MKYFYWKEEANRSPWYRLWSHSKAYRDFLAWRSRRGYLNWLRYADTHKLWLNVTQEHIAQYLPDSLSARVIHSLAKKPSTGA